MEFNKKFRNKIICGDAIKVLPDIPSDTIDLVITSPPYFNQREYETKGIGNECSIEKYLENLLPIFKECVRVTKRTGSIVFNLGDKYENGSLLLVPYQFALQASKTQNIKLINEVTWVKLNPTPKQAPKKLVPSTEPFFIFVKSNDYTFNKQHFLDLLDLMNSSPATNFRSNAGKKYYNLIEKSDLTEVQKLNAKYELEKAIKDVRSGKIGGFRMKIKGVHSLPYGGNGGGRLMHIQKDGFTLIKMSGNALKRDVIESPVETLKGNLHPAVYPEFIIQEFIKLLTKENDLVLDPFIGSGTSAVAAKRLGRDYIGIDISQAYCDYATERINKVKTNKNLESFT